MSAKSAIVLDKVSLALQVYNQGRLGRPAPQGTRVGGRIAKVDGHLEVLALDGISFRVNRGDRLGLIGANGAGKSTLLRVLAGIYKPTSGSCRVEGRISTLFTNNIGLAPEATGYENILLMGSLLGIGRRRAQALIPEIQEFSELGEYLDMPLRTYSAGMRTRLGFAIATSIQPDVLLVDEVIGAGDKAFQQKAAARIDNIFSTAGVLVLASHSTEIIASWCNRALWLDCGRLRMEGLVDDVIVAYREKSR